MKVKKPCRSILWWHSSELKCIFFLIEHLERIHQAFFVDPPTFGALPLPLLSRFFTINTSVCSLSPPLHGQHRYLCKVSMPDETKIKCALIAACTVACVRGEEDLPRGNDIFSLSFSDDNSSLLNKLHRIYAVIITFPNNKKN